MFLTASAANETNEINGHETGVSQLDIPADALANISKRIERIEAQLEEETVSQLFLRFLNSEH